MQITGIARDSRTFLISVLLVISFLTGCSSSAELQSEVQPTPQTSLPNIGTGGNLISIESDNVSAAGYDVESKAMTVRFDNGAMYEYYDVPTELWISFLAAQPHPWSQVGYPLLVKGNFRYQRIN